MYMDFSIKIWAALCAAVDILLHPGGQVVSHVRLYRGKLPEVVLGDLIFLRETHFKLRLYCRHSVGGTREGYDICKQQTFEAIESETDQKILDCIDYEKVKNTYIQALTEIEQWAGSKKKSFTEIEMWLIDETIKRAESPDSQIDPKTKAEITNLSLIHI